LLFLAKSYTIKQMKITFDIAKQQKTLIERMVVVVWTKRKGSKHIISMRKANEREQKKFKKRLEEITN
jgi:hypothetical protein